MKTIKVQKTIEEMPLEKAVDLCLRVLEKPRDVPQQEWANQIKKDLISGKKVFQIRELTLGEKMA